VTIHRLSGVVLVVDNYEIVALGRKDAVGATLAQAGFVSPWETINPRSVSENSVPFY